MLEQNSFQKTNAGSYMSMQLDKTSVFQEHSEKQPYAQRILIPLFKAKHETATGSLPGD